jgi:hypothetical protein
MLRHEILTARRTSALTSSAQKWPNCRKAPDIAADICRLAECPLRADFVLLFRVWVSSFRGYPCRAHCSFRGRVNPPHDGVRTRWRLNVAIAVALSDVRKEARRSTFARFLGMFEFRLLQQYPPTPDMPTTTRMTHSDIGCLAASSVWTALRAIANCGWSCYAALTI